MAQPDTSRVAAAAMRAKHEDEGRRYPRPTVPCECGVDLILCWGPSVGAYFRHASSGGAGGERACASDPGAGMRALAKTLLVEHLVAHRGCEIRAACQHCQTPACTVTVPAHAGVVVDERHVDPDGNPAAWSVALVDEAGSTIFGFEIRGAPVRGSPFAFADAYWLPPVAVAGAGRLEGLGAGRWAEVDPAEILAALDVPAPPPTIVLSGRNTATCQQCAEDDFLVPFGKHAGKRLSALPAAYAKWLLFYNRDDGGAPVERVDAAVASVLERREAIREKIAQYHSHAAEATPAWWDALAAADAERRVVMLATSLQRGGVGATGAFERPGWEDARSDVGLTINVWAAHRHVILALRRLYARRRICLRCHKVHTPGVAACGGGAGKHRRRRDDDGDNAAAPARPAKRARKDAPAPQ